MTEDAKKAADLSVRRKSVLAEAQERVRIRLAEPWTSYLDDLILYRTMNAQGIRLTDIGRLIEKHLTKQVPC